MQWKKFIEGVGWVHFRRSKKARRISIRIRPCHDVEVLLPLYSGLYSGEKFVLRKSTWIKSTQDRIRKRNNGSMLLEKHPEYEQIIAGWRKAALDYLPARLNEMALKYNFHYSKVSLRNNKTRWGSCSHKNNISLSIRLMRLPRHLADYVILHELVHTVHKNHGKEFWALLEEITGNARGLDRELSQYHPELF